MQARQGALEVRLRDPQLRQDILNRLKSIEGHIRGIQRMVEDDKYCVDIMNQTSAIHKALEKVDALILENHLQSCVTTAIRGDDPAERERVLRELLSLFQGGGSGAGGKRVQPEELRLEVTSVGREGSCCP